MTLSNIHTFIESGLDKYVTGGSAYQITSGIIKSLYYDDFDKYTNRGMIVYGWVGRGQKIDQSDSVFAFENAVEVWLVGRVNGYKDANESNVLKMADDLIHVMLTGDGLNTNGVLGQIEYDWCSEPLVDAENNTARVVVHGTAHYIISL